MPPLPVQAYRVERRYANGAVIRPLPGKSFTDEDVGKIAAWFKAAGWEVSTQMGSGVSGLNNIGMTADDIPEPYTAKQRDRDAAEKARTEAEDVKKAAQGAAMATPAGEFVAKTFGDAMNAFNSAAMAKFLSGETDKFGGLLNARAVDVLTAAGIAVEGRAVNDILADLKAMYQRGGAPASDPAPATDSPELATLREIIAGQHDSLPIADLLEKLTQATEALEAAGLLTGDAEALANQAIMKWAELEQQANG